MNSARILIVQHGEAQDTGLEERLRELGYGACTTVSSARQAVEAAASGCPDVALIDLGCDGACRAVEAAEQLGDEFDVPVIYLADGGREDTLRHAETAEAYGYVLKPVDMRQLHLSIQTTLRLRQKEKRRRESDRELRRTNKELRRQARIMDTILNSTKDGIVAADAAGHILFVNSPAERIVGRVDDMRPGELHDAPRRQKKYGLFALDKTTYIPTEQLPLVRAIQGMATDDKEVFIRNEASPEGVYVSVTGRTLWNEEEEVEGGVVFFRDISREKEAEAGLQRTLGELQDQTHLMGTVFESMNEAILVTTRA